MAYQQLPPESFLNKSMRVANQGVQIMGTLKGGVDAVRTIWGGLGTAAAYARPLLALM